MADKKKKSQNKTSGINITIQGDVIGSNLTAGNDNQSGINSSLSSPEISLPTYKNDSEIHPVGDLPLGSHLPFSPNALFTGREKELKALAENLLGDSKTGAVITQAVIGMGGLGKTQLAVEFGYRYGKYFRGVHWINLADPTQLDSEIATCGRQMFAKDFPEDQPSQVALTLKTWKTNGPNLLILDNFEETKVASDVLTKLRHSNIRILVTSRRMNWSQNLGLIQLPLDLFSLEESLQFLKDALKNRKDSEEDLKKIAERLGYLPLGLELASRYLNGHPRLSITNYLKQTENALDHASMKNWQVDMPAATGHDLDLQRTFALSWRELKDETAQKIFMVAGYLAPNTPIPLEIFERALEISAEKCDETLNLLYGLGLFRKGEDALPTIHPLLADYAQNLAKENKEILEILAAAMVTLSKEAIDTGIPANFLPIRPHMPVLATYAENSVIKQAGGLWNNYAYYLKNIVADYTNSRGMYERALKIFETSLGKEHPNVATLINNLGMVMKALGDLNGAKLMYERALKIDETNFATDHPNVAIDVNNLAGVYYVLGDLNRAKEMYKRALKIFETSLGKEHPNVATLINNLGMVMKDLGDLKDAKLMYERALKIDEAIFGLDHPSVAIDVNNLAGVYYALGDLNSAKEMYERALKIDEANFGLGHPNVAIDVSNLGLVMKALGDLNGAREMLERALKIDEAIFGKDHSSVGYNISSLAGVYYALEELNRAKEMYERALSIFKKFLPEDHPNIKIVQENLDILNKSK